MPFDLLQTSEYHVMWITYFNDKARSACLQRKESDHPPASERSATLATANTRRLPRMSAMNAQWNESGWNSGGRPSLKGTFHVFNSGTHYVRGQGRRGHDWHSGRFGTPLFINTCTSMFSHAEMVLLRHARWVGEKRPFACEHDAVSHAWATYILF